MSAMASQITRLTIVYSTVYSGTDERNASKLRVTGPLWAEFTGGRWIPRTRDQYRGKCFHLMTSSCYFIIYAWYEAMLSIPINIYIYEKDSFIFAVVYLYITDKCALLSNT